MVLLLDVAEYLPLLILDSRDKTDAFRGQLAGLSASFPVFAYALEQFDKPYGSE